ncbi:MAG: hypothetical protein ACRDTC_25940 [Pseudonocardiaceae bacterium]
MASGHSPQSAEDWATQLPAWRSAPRDAVNAFARVQAALWEGIAHDGPKPWTERLANAAQQWVEHRNTSPHN